MRLFGAARFFVLTWGLACAGWVFLSGAVCLAQATGEADAPNEVPETPAQRGFRWLRTKPYLPADFTHSTFEQLWENWPEPLRSQAERASPAERRKLAFSRYGMIEDPAQPNGPALGYTPDGKGGWCMNCLACHSGKVGGQPILGVPNSHFALQTLTNDVALYKLKNGLRLGHMEMGSLTIPLGSSNGTTNAVVFGVALGFLRDRDMNFVKKFPPPEFVHHDLDAPPFWNVKVKSRLYADGFVPKGHRSLLQFVMIPRNTGEKLREWESDFEDILAWIESLGPPRYPHAIDTTLAAEGKAVFEQNCARCHGTYGEHAKYPNLIVAREVVKTDPLRWRALSIEMRQSFEDGWLGHYGREKVINNPAGYVAPPLHGIWASAPYLHNGSVPTLWHVLHPDARPVVWQRTENGYDRERVGLEVATFAALPASVEDDAERRTYFDTRREGKSAAGHDFPSALSEADRRALLEYLKTL